MKMKTIIDQAGLKSCQFPKSSNVSVELFDGKNQLLAEVHYVEEIFSQQPKSKLEFFNFLNYLEANPVESLKIKIDEDFVTVFYKPTEVFAFRRSPSGDPLDIG